MGGDKGVNAAIKLEPAFLAQHEQALLAAGYMKGGWQGGRKGSGESMYRRGGKRGGWRGNQYGSISYSQSSGSGANRGISGVRKTNPKGTDGKMLRCHCCGSFQHLLLECPDS